MWITALSSEVTNIKGILCQHHGLLLGVEFEPHTRPQCQIKMFAKTLQRILVYNSTH